MNHELDGKPRSFLYAEIERLRAAYQSSQATVIKYWEQRNEDHKLIGELADWINRRKNKIHPTDPIHETLKGIIREP